MSCGFLHAIDRYRPQKAYFFLTMSVGNLRPFLFCLGTGNGKTVFQPANAIPQVLLFNTIQVYYRSRQHESDFASACRG
jgi:hypothetical protein